MNTQNNAFTLDEIPRVFAHALCSSFKIIYADVEVLDAGEVALTGDEELDLQRIEEGKKKNHWALKVLFNKEVAGPTDSTGKKVDFSGARISMDARAASDDGTRFAGQCIVKFTKYSEWSVKACTVFPVRLSASVSFSDVLAVAKALDSPNFSFRQVGYAAMGCRDWVLAFWARLATEGHVVGLEGGTILDVITSRYWPVESDSEDESDRPHVRAKLVDTGIWALNPPPHHRWIIDQGKKLEEIFEMSTVA